MYYYYIQFVYQGWNHRDLFIHVKKALYQLSRWLLPHINFVFVKNLKFGMIVKNIDINLKQDFKNIQVLTYR